NRETLTQHLAELTADGVVVYDTTDRTFKDFVVANLDRHDIRVYGLPMETLAIEAGGQKLMRNTVALGATFALLSLDFEFPAHVVSETFQHKGPEMVKVNVDVLRAGYSAITASQIQNFPWDITPSTKPEPHMLMTGND